MKIIILNKYEKKILKNYVTEKINYINEQLKHDHHSLYDFYENELRKTLECLLKLEKKLL